MTRSSPKTLSLPGFPADPIEGKVRLARTSLGIERILPALWPGAAFLLLYLALALTGAFAYVPWPAQSLLLAATITATALGLLNGFAEFSWPSAHDGARKLERDSGLTHRPLSERGDTLAMGTADAFTVALWQAHQRRALGGGEGLKIRPPQPDFRQRDPRGFRWLVLVALVLALVLGGKDLGNRLLSAFDSGTGRSATLDAWFEPPAYTGLPLLPAIPDENGMIAVPRGSKLALRVHGAPNAPGVTAGHNAVPALKGGNGEYATDVTFLHDARLRVRLDGHRLADWRIRALADQFPRIAFNGIPTRTEHDAVKFAFKASDDYGVTEVRALMVPVGRTGAPPLSVVLDGAGKTMDQTSFADLTAHPYSGLMVEARLVAKDGAAQSATSTPIRFRLPSRVFTDPLARALVEQRQNLASAPVGEAGKPARANVAFTLDALTYGKDLFYPQDKQKVFNDIRTAFRGVRDARTEADIRKVEDLLWKIAMEIERGGLLNAAAELRRVQALLNEALANGAPQEVIDALLKRYDEAMQRYMEALAANPEQGAGQPVPPDATTLRGQDIQQLMDMIKQLTESGNRAEAQQLLAMLQAMLENMRMVPGGQGDGQGPRDPKTEQQMGKLGELLGKQRQLLDKTFRQQQGTGDPQDGGPQGLARQQQQLQNELNDLTEQMDGQAQSRLRNGGNAMGESRDSLQSGNLDNSRNAQQNALGALAQGAQELARQAMSRNGQNERGAGGPEDPLGRSGSITGNSNVKIPDAGTLARSREILEELRKRAGQMARPQDERDYIDRLLKAF